jgi:hypothetical protein
MSRFFFSRPPESESAPAPAATKPADTQSELAAALASIAEIQSITTSAIFASLVSKGVMTADEAAGHMAEIAGALEMDPSPAGAAAARTLRSYGRALSVAAG